MDGDVCRRHECSLCCIGTEMDLTKADVKRITAAGNSNFHRYDEGGMVLRNVNGRCFFLEGSGKCGIYGIRPAGCRLYPLVMDVSTMTPSLDDECPYIHEFGIDPDDVLELAELIEEIGGI